MNFGYNFNYWADRKLTAVAVKAAEPQKSLSQNAVQLTRAGLSADCSGAWAPAAANARRSEPHRCT